MTTTRSSFPMAPRSIILPKGTVRLAVMTSSSPANINSDTYLAPEQLGMPFNSPYNDYMMVFDEVKGLGWFVSDRFQPEGKACVYLFIPNPEHKRVESEDIEVKRARAAITAIRDSWKESSDYADLIRLSHTEIPYGEKKIEKDFEFIIGNNIVYYKLDDINSPEAKGYYEKVVALNKQIKELNEKTRRPARLLRRRQQGPQRATGSQPSCKQKSN